MPMMTTILLHNLSKECHFAVCGVCDVVVVVVGGGESTQSGNCEGLKGEFNMCTGVI